MVARKQKQILSGKNKATPLTIRVILEAIGDGLTQRDAAALAGISEDTLSLWKRKDSDFSEQIRQKEIECKRRHIQNIHRAAEKSWQASAWWLERKHRAEYGRDDKEAEDMKNRRLGEIGNAIKAILGAGKAA